MSILKLISDGLLRFVAVLCGDCDTDVNAWMEEDDGERCCSETFGDD